VRWPQRAEGRRNYVLAQMAAIGTLSAERASRLAARPLGLDLRPVSFSEAPDFTDVVERFRGERYGRRRAVSGGLRVETTLDLRWQRAAERTVRNALGEPGDPSAALVAIDPRTGEIRALVGGRNWDRMKFNLATQAERQTGSAFKPFVLAAALEAGISPLTLMAGPSRLTIDEPRCSTNGEPWDVGNYSDAGFGTMSLADAMARSVNTIYAQLALEVGPNTVARVAERMGIHGPLAPVCSIALGVEEVTPLQMTSAFATIAAGGIRREPTPVRVVREDGRRLDRPVDVDGARVLSRRHAAVLTWAMRGVVERGTGTAAALVDRPVAGKTGTSQEYANAWFCGFVPQLAACVWVGHPEGNVPMVGVRGLSGVTGGSIPAAIWHQFMLTATARMKVIGFPEPDLSGYRLLPPPPMPAPPADQDEQGESRDDDGNRNGDGNGNGVGNGNRVGNGNGNGGGRDDGGDG
ncbi:MAG TPA: penicillin-binding transpeptidase domain-containing protein, partial [Actinomycetota bacterium]|nr:penicillin-binding transpeptidase domain-containing protein [Actinomycetota bacterium]